MKDILKRIKSGELTRDNDEKYADGFWDVAGEIVNSSTDFNKDELQEKIYNVLWEIVESE